MNQFVDLVGIVLTHVSMPLGRGNTSGCGVIPVDSAGQGCSSPSQAPEMQCNEMDFRSCQATNSAL